MYVPKGYRPQDPSWAMKVVRGNPLALLVTNGGRSPSATHLPVIPDMTTAAHGSGETGLVGMTFFGHLNRQNPHWGELAGVDKALLVFENPGGYISPTYYEQTPAAPTWNFISVHVRGALQTVDEAEEKRRIIRATVSAYEADLGTGWDMTQSLDYFEELLPGIGAFRFVVEEAEAMFKLSQEKTPEVRAKVVSALDADGSSGRQCLAATMREFT